MPVIARFYGMVVKMYLLGSEHNPPHIHVIYGEYIGVIDLRTLSVLEGDLPPKALALALEWTHLHQEELMEMWTTQEFRQLPPLQ